MYINRYFVDYPPVNSRSLNPSTNPSSVCHFNSAITFGVTCNKRHIFLP